MAASFFFYDLETSGINPREQRIMQFAGQRTDMNLEPIGEPFNIVIKLTSDVLPEPEAVLLTGITPQQTISEGVTEAEFLKVFEAEIATPDTIFVGFNTVRFDDEFVRYTRYRNFYDAYDWQWKDGRSRWDILDLSRMTRALRPEGIEWPFTEDGVPTNKLELITKLNGLDHEHAHDALNDVLATIAVAKLIRDKQPKLFDFLLNVRDKKSVATLVNAGAPFVYSSGKYGNDVSKTAVVSKVADDISKQGALVYDLRFDPDEFTSLSVKELVELWRWKKEPDAKRLPVKSMKFNRCPAVAPISVVDQASQQRLGVDTATWQANFAKLRAATDFPAKLREAQALMESERTREFMNESQPVDAQLYDGFIGDHDANLQRVVRAAEPAKLADLASDFHDARLKALLPLYKARNFPEALDSEERAAWDGFCAQKLFDGGNASQMAKYFERLADCATKPEYQDKQFLLEELQLYGQSIMPTEL
ncbi:MAG TPA: exodeoxyribonuclease I [Candidatus Microsaccharimonas sp.]|nr:exodeoxyribonuclease I [Candidatus Microsaccharimonas sp.]